jgi:hypothetical protein
VAAGDGVGGLAFDPVPIVAHNSCAMAETADDLIRLLREHAPAWSERFGVSSLRIFGSWARGSATPESDVDLLVAFSAPSTARQFYGLQVFLEDLLGRPVDLVTEQALRQELRQSVEADAISI